MIGRDTSSATKSNGCLGASGDAGESSRGSINWIDVYTFFVYFALIFNTLNRVNTPWFGPQIGKVSSYLETKVGDAYAVGLYAPWIYAMNHP